MCVLLCIQLSLLVLQTRGMPSGAPTEACTSIFPTGHGGTSQNLLENPFSLDFTRFSHIGCSLYYVPEQTYEIILKGAASQFRGFLVQARTLADESPVGNFIVADSGQRLSSCAIPASAVTHANASIKTEVSLKWTAPAYGCGQIKFYFAVVQRFNQNINTFWATAKTATLHACGLPLYESSCQCVETCPNGQIGIGDRTTLVGVCEPLPLGFSIGLNATIYYADIFSDTPLNTPVYRIRVIINAVLGPIELSAIELKPEQNGGLMGFEGDGNNRLLLSDDDLMTIGNERVFDTSISLVAEPSTQFEDDEYPVPLEIAILLVVFHSGTVQQVTSRGLGHIILVQDPYYSSGNYSFTGVDCETNIDDCTVNDCVNGACVDAIASYSCACDPGFTGSLCNEEIDECKEVDCNNGTCMDLVNDYTCDCYQDYTGQHCNDSVGANCHQFPCEQYACQNGGTCTEDDGNTFNCICAPGYSGNICNVSVCNDMCLNGGTCIASESFGTQCACEVGYTGTSCETQLPSCQTSNNYCRNGGTCFEAGEQEIVCNCKPQFTGRQCERAICPAEEDTPVYSGSGISYSWPQTEPGRSQNEPCPVICQGLINYTPGAVVVRECDAVTAQWLDADITGCGFSTTALKLCEVNQLESSADQAAAVVNITSYASTLESSAITVTAHIIHNLTDAAIEEPLVRDRFLTAIDNVLGANVEELLLSQTESNSSTIILHELNRFLDLVPLDNETGNFTFTLNNFGLIAFEINTRNGTRQTFNFKQSANPMPVNVTLSPEQLLVTTEAISSATGSLSPQGLDTCSSVSDTQRIAYSVFRSHGLFLTPETACEQFAIGSVILGVRVPNRSICNTSVIGNMRQLAEVCAAVLDTSNIGAKDISNKESICSKFVENIKGGTGRWSSDSCRKVRQVGGRTTCDCSQLGHFGLLFDLDPGDSLSPLSLAVISYTGAILSIVCLIIVIITYLSSKKLRKMDHGKLLVNLSISLIGVYMVFMIAGLVTSIETLCGLVSALLQYFMLVFFGWTAAEAVILYYKLVIVLGRPINHFILKAALVVWFIPLLITVLSVGLGYKYYINPYYCRATEWPFWFGLILPFSITYMFNWIIFIIIMIQMLRKRSCNSDTKTDRHKVAKRNVLIAAGLSLLFGLGWGFGLTATSSDAKEVTFAFQILFSVFVGSQGVLIFVFYGIRSPHFRQVWTAAFGKRKRFPPSLNKHIAKEHSGQSSTTVTGAPETSNCQQKMSSLSLSDPREGMVEMAMVAGNTESFGNEVQMGNICSPKDTIRTEDV